ncbi:MAG: methyltransferase family protein [Planctomycetota bacterium]
MDAKSWLLTILVIFLYAALLFGGAGTLFWLEGWLFFGCLLALIPAMLSLKDPDLIKERMASPFQKEQKTWDKVFFAVLTPIWLIWLVLNGMDAVRFEWSHVPWPLKVLGGIGYLLEERKQHVISTGPYAFVRHPMYSGAFLVFLGGSLLLGSCYGLALDVVIIVLFVARTALEDRMLQRELDGYHQLWAILWRKIITKK